MTLYIQLFPLLAALVGCWMVETIRKDTIK